MKILFISHDAYRAGAQLLLLQFLQYIRKNKPEIEFKLILGNEGELLSEFKRLTDVLICNKKYNMRNKSLRFFFKFLYKIELCLFMKQNKFDIIYSNTIMNGEILNMLSRFNVPIITHVHETDYWMDKTEKKNLEYNSKHNTKFIAVSEAVKQSIIRKLNVSESLIEVIYEFTQKEYSLNSLKSLKQELNLPENSMIIGACGAESYRKGKDLFIAIANHYFEIDNTLEAHFVWIGGSLDNEILNQYNTSPYKKKIHFISHLPGASDYFHEFDVFCMTSRDDPFPIVNLEAGIREVPILCFRDSGGTQELLDDYKELVIEDWSVIEFAKKINELLHNHTKRKILGKELNKLIREKYLIDNIAPQLLAEIKKTVSNEKN